jgi:two-component system, OmpR family, sensor histidine kinase KdpD
MDRRVAAPVGSVAALGVATGLVYAVKPIAPVLSLGVLYTPAVLAAAVLFGAVWAIAVAVAAMLAFNFLFLPPVHTLTLADARNWTALAVYLLTAIVCSNLATSARRRAAEAEQRERESALLADASAAVLGEEPLDEIRERAQHVLAGELAHARFEAGVESLLALAEQRLHAEAVRRSDALKTLVLQAVSHDFRTPIATIRAAVDGLQAPDLTLSPEDRAELLDTIALEVARLARLVESVLDLSRLEAGVAAPRTEVWEIDDVLARAMLDLPAGDRIRINVADGLPPVAVDADQIQRVLANVLENALKYSAGGVEVLAHTDGVRVLVDVLDEGGAPIRPGLGLGLTIAHGFAEANGATLELLPREGRGTRARLSLPMQRIPEAVAT